MRSDNFVSKRRSKRKIHKIAWNPSPFSDQGIGGVGGQVRKFDVITLDLFSTKQYVNLVLFKSRNETP